MDFGWLASVSWYGWVTMFAVMGLCLWQYDRVAVLLGRPVPTCPVVPDGVMWQAGEVFAAGLSVPVIIIDYDRRVRVYNRGAEDLTGHPFYAVHNHPFGLLLPDEDDDSFKGWLDRYLKEFREGDTVQMVGHPRPMRIERKDGMVREVVATLTHFGNGHGGIQIELLPVG